MDRKRIDQQHEKWLRVLKDNYRSHGSVSYNWGDPIARVAMKIGSEKDYILGNYRKIKDEYLLPFIKNKRVLDLGCFDGKWTSHMWQASEIICMNLFSDGFWEFMEKGSRGRLEIVKKSIFLDTNGYDLKALGDESIDYIFCMDTLVENEKEVIQSYLNEFHRVLAKGGRGCIHLPCVEIGLCSEFGYTPLFYDEIVQMGYEANLSFKLVEIINHGVLMIINDESTNTN